MPETPHGKPAEYHVLKRGEMLGPFSEAELRAALADGRFEMRDFVQVEGEVAWRPLGRILDAPGDEMKGAVAPDWHSILKWAWLRLRYNLDEQTMAAGSICLVLGTLALVLSRFPFVFWMPWFLAAIVAAITLFRRNHEGKGALLLAAVICVPWLVHNYGPILHTQKAARITQNAPAGNPPAPVPVLAPEPSIPAAAPATPNPAPAPVAAIATPTPSAVTLIPAAAGPPALPSSANSIPPTGGTAASAAPAPAAPAPESLLAMAGRIADSVVPFFVGAKASVPTLPTPAQLTAPLASALQDFKLGDKSFGALTEPDVDLVQSHNDAFVIVKGTNGSGSGFICRVGDKTWLFSNIHVVSEIKEPTITQLNGVPIVPGAAELAAGPDIARMSLTKLPMHPLEAITDFENDVHIGDAVAVLGNSGGGGVVTSLKGKVVGIGPDRLEVSAQFIPGNSGSPIVHVKTGKVIGIATYLTRRYEEFAPNTPEATPSPRDKTGAVVVRRFGYRIDKVPVWEPVNWGELSREAQQIDQISKLTEDIFNFLAVLHNGGEPQFATDALRRPAMEWLEKLKNHRVGDSDRLSATQSFLNALRFMVRGDVATANGQLRYTYFRNRLAEEQKVRDRLYKAFDGDLAKLGSPLSQHAYHRR